MDPKPATVHIEDNLSQIQILLNNNIPTNIKSINTFSGNILRLTSRQFDNLLLAEEKLGGVGDLFSGEIKLIINSEDIYYMEQLIDYRISSVPEILAQGIDDIKLGTIVDKKTYDELVSIGWNFGEINVEDTYENILLMSPDVIAKSKMIIITDIITNYNTREIGEKIEINMRKDASITATMEYTHEGPGYYTIFDRGDMRHKITFTVPEGAFMLLTDKISIEENLIKIDKQASWYKALQELPVRSDTFASLADYDKNYDPQGTRLHMFEYASTVKINNGVYIGNNYYNWISNLEELQGSLKDLNSVAGKAKNPIEATLFVNFQEPIPSEWQPDGPVQKTFLDFGVDLLKDLDDKDKITFKSIDKYKQPVPGPFNDALKTYLSSKTSLPIDDP